VSLAKHGDWPERLELAYEGEGAFETGYTVELWYYRPSSAGEGGFGPENPIVDLGAIIFYTERANTSGG
jgi:hypothetical protein